MGHFSLFISANCRTGLTLLTLVLLLFSLQAEAQSTVPEFSKKQRRKMRREAQQHIYVGELDKGAELYKKLIAADTSNYALNRDLGLLLCFDMNSKAEALPYLEAAIRNSPKDTLPDLLFAAGQSYAASYQFDKAEQHYKLLKSMLESGRVSSSANSTSLKAINYEIEQCQTLQLARKPNQRTKNSFADDIVITNAGEKINSPFPEYAPALYEGGKLLLFTTRRPDSKNSGMDTDGLYFESMYAAYMVGDSVVKVAPFEFSDTLQYLIDNSKQHESIIMFSPDGNWLFLYKNNMIYCSYLLNGIWSKPRPMMKSVNAGDYQNHITASADGLTLIIAGNHAGGRGGLDLYSSTLVNDSSWSELVPIGDSINTSGNEEGPFLSTTGDTLYFASDKLPGWGGYDLFYSVRGKFGNFGAPVNMGQPYNTPDDDIFLQWIPGSRGGLMASNRK
ncbi:MAG: hypothetical protein ACRC3B_11040, partial [Bacteroidia bacterium]